MPKEVSIHASAVKITQQWMNAMQCPRPTNTNATTHCEHFDDLGQIQIVNQF